MKTYAEQSFLQKVRLDGSAAASLGVKASVLPYKSNSEYGKSWLAGYRDGMTLKKRVKRNPSRRTRSPAQRAATARLVALNKAKKAAKIDAYRKTQARRSNDEADAIRLFLKKRVRGNPAKRNPARKRRAPNTGLRPGHAAAAHCKYSIQVKKGAGWLTLCKFATQAAAAEYGRTLARKYAKQQFRVFW